MDTLGFLLFVHWHPSEYYHALCLQKCLQCTAWLHVLCDCCDQSIHAACRSSASWSGTLMDTPLVPVFPWLNSNLLTGRRQFSAWLNCDSHVSDCTDDVCARDITIPALLHLMVSGLLSLPHQQKHEDLYVPQSTQRIQEKKEIYQAEY